MHFNVSTLMLHAKRQENAIQRVQDFPQIGERIAYKQEPRKIGQYRERGMRFTSGRARHLSFLSSISPLEPTASCPVVTGSFLSEPNDRHKELITYLYLVARLRTYGTVPHSPLCLREVLTYGCTLHLPLNIISISVITLQMCSA